MSIEHKSSQLSRGAGKEGVQNDLRNTLIVKIVHNIFKRLKFMFYRQTFSTFFFIKLSGAETGLEERKSEHSSLTEMKNQNESDQDSLNKELDAALLHYETQMKEMELEVEKWNEALNVEASCLESENEKLKNISGEIEKIREELIVCDDELMSSEKKVKEENTRLSGFEEDNRRAGETAASSRSRTEELVSQLENKEQAVNSLKERMIELNLELEKELAASLPAEEDKMYEIECEKYEKLIVKLECLKLSRTESEKVLQEGSDRLQDLEFKITEVKRSGKEFAQSEKYTEMQEVVLFYIF